MSMSENELVWHLYRQMFFCRQFENAIAELWHNGDISGEMHLGTGEEGIVAGVVSQLQEAMRWRSITVPQLPCCCMGLILSVFCRRFAGTRMG